MTDGLVHLRRYKRSLEVLAAKILELRHSRDGGCVITIEDSAGSRHTDFTLSPTYVAEHKPHVGGYFLCYENGLESFAPASLFEGNYIELDGGQNAGPTGETMRRVHVLELQQINVGAPEPGVQLTLRARPFDVPEDQLVPGKALDQVSEVVIVPQDTVMHAKTDLERKKILKAHGSVMSQQWGMAVIAKLVGGRWDGD